MSDTGGDDDDDNDPTTITTTPSPELLLSDLKTELGSE